MSRLANLRKGIPDNKIVKLPRTDEDVAIVALNNKDIIEAREAAMKFITNHPVDIDTGDLILNMYTLKSAMRDPDDLKVLFAEGFDDINEHMDPKSVYELHNTFIEVQNGKSDDLENLSSEEFEELKKKLKKMELKELDGELQTILKYFHQSLGL